MIVYSNLFDSRNRTGSGSLSKEIVYANIKPDVMNNLINKLYLKLTNTQKVIINRIILASVISLDYYTKSISVFVSKTINKDFFQVKVSADISITDNIPKINISAYMRSNLKNGFQDDVYINDRNMRKYNIAKYMEGSNCVMLKYPSHGTIELKKFMFEDGGIGNDFIHEIYKDMDGFGSCVGAVGVGIAPELNRLYNMSGYVIKDYAGNKDEKDRLRKATEDTFPSVDLLSFSDFCKIFGFSESIFMNNELVDSLIITDENINITLTALS